MVAWWLLVVVDKVVIGRGWKGDGWEEGKIGFGNNSFETCLAS